MSEHVQHREPSRDLIRILGISGSLRARSSSTELLRVACSITPADARITLFGGLDALPHFNPDLDEEGAEQPGPVEDFRRRVRNADALLICSPEYAHGVPGALKNALDWLVSVPDVVQKPVGLLNPSPRSWHAQASLAETLRTMSMTLITDVSIVVPLTSPASRAEAFALDSAPAAALRGVIDALVGAAKEYRAQVSQESSK
jgi:NAD(P)H-dependent FMN reductase